MPKYRGRVSHRNRYEPNNGTIRSCDGRRSVRIHAHGPGETSVTQTTLGRAVGLAERRYA